MIEFRCPNCNQKIRTQPAHAGTLGRCPRCRSKIPVPLASSHVTPTSHQGSAAAAGDNSESGQARGPAPTELPAGHSGRRRHLWPLDILLYPTSRSGLGNLAVIVGVPSVLMAVRRLFTPPFLVQVDASASGQLLITLYTIWYLGRCVSDSALGGTRAPGVVVARSDWRTMLLRVIYLGAVGLLLFLPAELYLGYSRQQDIVFLGLLGCAGFLFPMAFLAMVLFQAGRVLNPLFLLRAIIRTLPHYLLLLAFFAAVFVGWQRLSGSPMAWQQPLWLKIVKYAITTYGTFILGHLLGRFYWRHRQRLNWDF